MFVVTFFAINLSYRYSVLMPCRIKTMKINNSEVMPATCKPGVLLYALQNYTGHLSTSVILDIKDYTLAGTGTNLKPGPDKTFNWVAQTRCLVIGCMP
jgi:hypothetical protein